MVDMNGEHLPGSPVPGVPPRLNRTRLWVSLLVPPVVTLALTVAFLVVVSQNLSGRTDSLFTILCIIACLVTMSCWGLFIHTLNERLRGASFVLLVLAYPVLQVVMAVAVFFTGCVTMVFTG